VPCETGAARRCVLWRGSKCGLDFRPVLACELLPDDRVDFVGPFFTIVLYDSHELTLVVHPSLRLTVGALRGDVDVGSHVARHADMRHAPSFPCIERVHVRTRCAGGKAISPLILEDVQVWVIICAGLTETTPFFPTTYCTAKMVISSGSLLYAPSCAGVGPAVEVL
jgi:hypothetical protein